MRVMVRMQARSIGMRIMHPLMRIAITVHSWLNNRDWRIILLRNAEKH